MTRAALQAAADRRDTGTSDRRVRLGVAGVLITLRSRSDSERAYVGRVSRRTRCPDTADLPGSLPGSHTNRV